ncbi:uncharacterized protein LOC142344000 [Convolutriloba macropyga]|uniref:uncharacterized protein LOC142344000 n=1 Tax=Convolutriloba macropyga TaxID=536237 RepID=UPI003F521796
MAKQDAAAVKPRRISTHDVKSKPSIVKTLNDAHDYYSSHRFSIPTLLEQRPSLTKIDVFKQRNPTHVSILVDILAQGYSLTYKELFNLIKEEEDSERHYPSRANYVLLKNDKDTLTSLAVSLCKCEDSGRRGDFRYCYQERAQVAKQFKQAHRRVLALHFYRTAAVEAKKITKTAYSGESEGQSENDQYVECMAKADLDYGQRLLEEKMLTEAKTYLETAHEVLTSNSREGTDLFKDVCRTLSKINMELGSEVVKRALKVTQVARGLFEEAYKMVKQSNDHRATQSICIQLSEIFTKHNEPKMARKFLAQVRNKTPNTDLESYCKSCRELAKSLLSSRKFQEALNVLSKSGREIDAVKRREGYSTKMALIKGTNCNLQCRVYNAKGNYVKATNAGHNAMYHLQNAIKSRNTAAIAAKDLDGSPSSAKVNLSIARAHAHWGDYVDILQQEREDYTLPTGLLGTKLRGLTAQILYFDKHSNVKMRMESMSRIPVTSRKSSMTESRDGYEETEDQDGGETHGAKGGGGGGGRGKMEGGNTMRVDMGHTHGEEHHDHTSTVDSFSVVNRGRADMSHMNLASLSEIDLMGLLQIEDSSGSNNNDWSSGYYYEYETLSDFVTDDLLDRYGEGEGDPDFGGIGNRDTKNLVHDALIQAASQQPTKRVTEATTLNLKEDEDHFETFKVYNSKSNFLTGDEEAEEEEDENQNNLNTLVPKCVEDYNNEQMPKSPPNQMDEPNINIEQELQNALEENVNNDINDKKTEEQNDQLCE